MTNIQAIILIAFIVAAIIVHLIDKNKAYQKGRADERQWQKENNHEAKCLMGGAVNRGYAEWRVYDAQTGKTDFKWIEPKSSNGGLTKL